MLLLNSFFYFSYSSSGIICIRSFGLFLINFIIYSQLFYIFSSCISKLESIVDKNPTISLKSIFFDPLLYYYLASSLILEIILNIRDQSIKVFFKFYPFAKRKFISPSFNISFSIFWLQSFEKQLDPKSSLLFLIVLNCLSFLNLDILFKCRESPAVFKL